MCLSSSFSSHASVTYTYVSTNNDLPPWGFHLMDAYEPKALEAAPQSPEQAPFSLVPAPKYTLLADALPTACSPGYIADSEPIEDDSEEDPVMDPIDYPSSKEEEEPSALTDRASPIPDSVPSFEETEPFETNETIATLPPPVSLHNVVPLSQTSIHRAGKTVQPQPPLPASIKAHIAEYVVAPHLHHHHHLHYHLYYLHYPGFHHHHYFYHHLPVGISFLRRTCRFRKRARFIAPSNMFKIGESSTAIS
nr:hypothetical protein [Tanacetum cinerariifolium]